MATKLRIYSYSLSIYKIEIFYSPLEYEFLFIKVYDEPHKSNLFPQIVKL